MFTKKRNVLLTVVCSHVHTSRLVSNKHLFSHSLHSCRLFLVQVLLFEYLYDDSMVMRTWGQSVQLHVCSLVHFKTCQIQLREVAGRNLRQLCSWSFHSHFGLFRLREAMVMKKLAGRRIEAKLAFDRESIGTSLRRHAQRIVSLGGVKG